MSAMIRVQGMVRQWRVRLPLFQGAWYRLPKIRRAS
jgi:hypothetical protein